MRKFYFLSCGILFILLSIIGCKNDDVQSGKAFDPNQPVKFHEFLPDSGGIRTKFVIKGSNFGNDKAKVKVYFKDSEGNERESIILGLANNVIYTIVPKQSDGQSSIRVAIDGKNAELEHPDKTFRYVVASTVSTVVGRQKDAAGHTNGTLAETTFDKPRYLTIDNEDNIIVSEESSMIRLISLNGNKSITLHNNGQSCEQPFKLNDKQSIWYTNKSGGGGLFIFDANTSWAMEPYGKLLKDDFWVSGMILDPIDSTYTVIRQNTGEIWVQPFKKGMTEAKKIQIGLIRQGGSQSSLVYNKVDGYIYITLHNQHGVWRFKLKKGPEGYPILDGEPEQYIDNGMGAVDGDFSEAKMNLPRGIAIDAEGNIYVADTNNHAIRKINIKTNSISTIAGKLGQAGYADGEPIKEALFREPYGIALDKDGFLYIGDTGNKCIRKLAIE